MRYHKGIDVIRAIAILGVLGYHGKIPGFSGGFVGVDVFFVISGYLMTARIVNELETSSFSFINYFERRLRRLLPALLLLVSVVMVLGLIFMFPNDLQALTSDVPWVLLSGANILYWKSHDYFAAPPETLWLLHTWSLGVEEQAYIVLPVILVLLSHVPAVIKKFSLALMIGTSLGVALLAGPLAPVANFYLLPTRFWEICSGAALAIFLANRTLHDLIYAKSVWIFQLLGGLGLLFIAYATITFKDVEVWPNAQTLIPVFGTLLLIFVASGDVSHPKFLSSTFLAIVGKGSYGSYLWHFPVLMLVSYLTVDEASLLLRLVIIGPLSIGLGILSNYFLEQPIRDSKVIPRGLLYPAILTILTVLITGSIVIQKSDGFPSRFTSFQNSMFESYGTAGPMLSQVIEGSRRGCDLYVVAQGWTVTSNQDEWSNLSSECYEGGRVDRPSLFLWGDSHAAHLRVGLTAEFSSDWNIYQITTSGCAPGTNPDELMLTICRRSNTLALRAIGELRPEVVIVAQGDWSILTREAVETRTAALLKAGAKAVVQVGPVPNWTRDLPHIVIRQSRKIEDVEIYSDYGLVKDVLTIDNVLTQTLTQSKSFRYVSATDWFCSDFKCRVYSGETPVDSLTSFDRGHLTAIAASEFVRGSLGAVIREVVPVNQINS